MMLICIKETNGKSGAKLRFGRRIMMKIIRRTVPFILILCSVIFLRCMVSFAAGHNLSEATPLALGQTVEGDVSSSSKSDYYKVDLPENMVVRFDLKATGSGKPVYLNIRNSDGKKLFQILTKDPNNWGYDTGVLYISLTKGINYVKLDPLWNRQAHYTLSVTELARNGSKYNIAGSGTNYLKDAHPLSLGQTIYDTGRETFNTYRFSTSTALTLSLNVKVIDDYNSGQIYVDLLDSQGSRITRVKNGSTEYLGYDSLGKGYDFSWKLDPGDYFIKVSTLWNSYTDSVRYTIDTAGIIPLDIPQLKSAKNKDKGVEVKWGSAAGADGYYILRKSGAEWAKIATVTGNGTVSYTDQTAENGIQYAYTVQPWNSKTTGPYDVSGKRIVRLKTPRISSLTNQKKKKAVLKWTKNSAASYYVVSYAKNASFAGAKIKRVKGTAKKVLSSLSKNKTYYFRVRTAAKKGSAVYSSAWSKTKKLRIRK